MIQSFSKNTKLKEEASFVSYEYQKETPRTAFAFEQQKTSGSTKSFITILYPYKSKEAPQIALKENANNDLEKGLLNLTITIDGKTRTLKENLTN
ncbi:Heparin-sulfate lyase precursor [compost metagenome]